MHRPFFPLAPWRAVAITTILLTTALHALTAHAGVTGVELPKHRPIPILTYHRFGHAPGDSVTVRVDSFVSHLRAIRHAGFQVVPLEQVLAWYRGDVNTLPERAVVITMGLSGILCVGHNMSLRSMYATQTESPIAGIARHPEGIN
ncbi:hypothetical protein [Cupriavidus sp. SW-Y-13]|uniref:hypothetical protein n=1 Tax=Cupriavidus sp. SW-Y-13 TaxID=2653854 RepID=UPI001365E8A8|nr:hypothetical protein [Cupriavidus sp. SW-Y-13]MWL88928.1 hypothetical protein [Cupriavidus sp. SW-Y-13]